jgi:hypothetical protein
MSDNSSRSVRSGGIGIGCILALILSVMKWHSVGWAIVHCFLGWFYVIWYVCVYGMHIG